MIVRNGKTQIVDRKIRENPKISQSLQNWPFFGPDRFSNFGEVKSENHSIHEPSWTLSVLDSADLESTVYG